MLGEIKTRSSHVVQSKLTADTKSFQTPAILAAIVLDLELQSTGTAIDTELDF